MPAAKLRSFNPAGMVARAKTDRLQMPYPSAAGQQVMNATRHKAIPLILADDAAQVGHGSHPLLLSFVHNDRELEL